MSWEEGVEVVVVLLGLGGGAFLVAQRPSFWIAFGVRLGKALLPRVLKYVSRRMLPDEEAVWREAERRGQRCMAEGADIPKVDEMSKRVVALKKENRGSSAAARVDCGMKTSGAGAR